MIYDLLIVGGGAAGLFLAANLQGQRAIILEQNGSVGRKILVSGGGRCNVTNRNISEENYLGDKNFVREILQNFSFKDSLEFFGESEFVEQKQNQFFCKNGSKQVLNTLLKTASQKAEILTNHKAVSAIKNGEIFEIFTVNGAKFQARNLAIATGGLSYKSLGVSDFGYETARNFGLSFSSLSPALVGLTVQKDEFWFKDLSGVSVVATVGVGERKFSSEVLFTHKGISGPAILNASLFWQKGQIWVDFLPNFDFAKIERSKKQLSTILPLPRRFVLRFLQNFELFDKPFNEYKQSEKDKILALKCYKFAPAGTFGFERAEVTRGGVLSQNLSANCESTAVKGLFFIGEVLDITGMLGGYNLHFAFASALSVAKELNLGLR